MPQNVQVGAKLVETGRAETNELGVFRPMKAKSDAVRLIDAKQVATQIRLPGPTDDKYSRGVVCLATGSKTYPGAGLLSALGAQGAGPGFVRFTGAKRPSELVLSRLPEVVLAKGFFHAAVLGSGWDEDEQERASSLADECAKTGRPLVVDAGALVHAPRWAESNENLVLTPHAGEALALLQNLDEQAQNLTRQDIDGNPQAAVRLANLSGALVVLKGAQTLVATPTGEVSAYEAHTAWAATAGAGDVLAGVIGSFLAGEFAQAQKENRTPSILRLTEAAVAVHGMAAAVAAGTMGDSGKTTGSVGHPIVASDIARAVPIVLGLLLDWNSSSRGHLFETSSTKNFESAV